MLLINGAHGSGSGAVRAVRFLTSDRTIAYETPFAVSEKKTATTTVLTCAGKARGSVMVSTTEPTVERGRWCAVGIRLIALRPSPPPVGLGYGGDHRHVARPCTRDYNILYV